jgi:septum formation protein
MSVSVQSEPIILASASATRRDMLSAAGIAFEVRTSDVDEAPIKEALLAQGADPRAICRALATAKAEAVSALYPERWVLGGDSVVSVEGRLFSKPHSRSDAAAHLAAFSSRLMTLDSSVVLVRGGVMVDYASDDAHLEVRTLSEAFIERYLDAEWPAIGSCVGCFRIEGLGVHLFERTTGSQFTILGMPLLALLGMLREHRIIAA